MKTERSATTALTECIQNPAYSVNTFTSLSAAKIQPLS
jgi:hypothetical protein